MQPDVQRHGAITQGKKEVNGKELRRMGHPEVRWLHTWDFSPANRVSGRSPLAR